MIDPIVSIRSAKAGRRWRTDRLWSLFCLAFVLSACGPTRQVVLDPTSPQPPHERTAVAGHSTAAVESRLRAEVARWDGTPHRLGGTTSRGIDCSAFVQNVYADAFELSLPRTTNEQVRSGTAVKRSELQPGDLVFFKPRTKTRHVGIYLDGGEFAHASTSQGVTISDMDQDYWVNSYWTSRRILARPDQPVVADGLRTGGVEPRPNRPAERDVGTRTPTRIGW